MGIYVIKSNIALLIFLCYYWFVLRKDTTFRSNRFYLLGTLIISMIFPLIHFSWDIDHSAVSSLNQVFIPVHIQFQPGVSVTPEQMSWWTWSHTIFLVYGLGTLFILVKYIVQIYPWIKQIPGDNKNAIKIVKTDKSMPPFSFINTIFLGEQEFTPEELNKIIFHEKQHILQYHWIDVLIVDLISILYWFNPLIWIYDLLIKQNHEYLADNGVIAQGFNKTSYQTLLLQQVVGVKIPGLSNGFAHSLIKNRFIMMTKNHSRKSAGIKALLALPLILFLSIIFSANTNQPFSKNSFTGVQGGKIYGYVFDFSSGQPLEKASVVFNENETVVGTSTNSKGFFELKTSLKNPTLLISYVGYETSIVEIKDLETKVYLKRVNYPVTVVGNREGLNSLDIPPSPPTEVDKKIEKVLPPIPPVNPCEVYTAVEDMPAPNGGFEGLSEYINTQLAVYRTDELKGKIAMVFVTINELGKPTSIKLNKTSGNRTADKAALEIIKNMPDWKPGSQQGKHVPVDYIIDIEF